MCSRWRGTCGRGSSEGRAIPVPPDSHGSRASTSVTERPALSPLALPGRHGGRRGGPRDPGSRTRRGVPVPLPHCAWGAATGRSRPPPGSAGAVPQAWGQPLPPLGRPSRCEHTWPLMSGTRGGDPNWWRSASCSVLPRAGPHRPPHSALRPGPLHAPCNLLFLPSLSQAHLSDAPRYLPRQEQHSGGLRVPALQPVRHIRYVGPRRPRPGRPSLRVLPGFPWPQPCLSAFLSARGPFPAGARPRLPSASPEHLEKGQTLSMFRN